MSVDIKCVCGGGGQDMKKQILSHGKRTEAGELGCTWPGLLFLTTSDYHHPVGP